jgi:hypothetical protein
MEALRLPARFIPTVEGEVLDLKSVPTPLEDTVAADLTTEPVVLDFEPVIRPTIDPDCNTTTVIAARATYDEPVGIDLHVGVGVAEASIIQANGDIDPEYSKAPADPGTDVPGTVEIPDGQDAMEMDRRTLTRKRVRREAWWVRKRGR